jgi:hypothetical protein
MVPGTIYQVSYTGSDGKALTVVAKHVATVGLKQLRLLHADGTGTIDQGAVVSGATSLGPIGKPH